MTGQRQLSVEAQRVVDRAADIAGRSGQPREWLLARQRADPEPYRALNPSNGWGSYESAVADLLWLLDGDGLAWPGGVDQELVPCGHFGVAVPRYPGQRYSYPVRAVVSR